jgi:hypothetical protein
MQRERALYNAYQHAPSNLNEAIVSFLKGIGLFLVETVFVWRNDIREA